MWAAPVAGHTGDGRDHLSFIVLVEFKVFLVDPGCHREHMTGDILFRFCVTGEVQAMRGAVGGLRVAKITMNAKRGLPGIHDLIQIIMADILRKHL